MLKKTTLREIKNSLGRYLAILAIAALGVGFFSGLKVTREAMLATADDYLAKAHFFDYQVMSSLGFEEEDVTALSKAVSVKTAEGSVSTDILFTAEDGGADRVLKLHSVPESINTLKLESGRMPKKANECVVDYSIFSEEDLGSTIRISENNEEDTLDMLKYKEYTIVGTAVSPIYLNFERGSTALGDGSVAGFAYIPKDGFDTDYYTEVYLQLSERYEIYSDQYKALIDSTEEAVTAAAEKQSDRRYKEVVKEAKKELADGQKEYDENYSRYLSEKADAESELAASYQKLTDGRAEISRTEQDLDAKEKQLLAKRKELNSSKKQVEAGIAETAAKRQQFEANKPYMTPEQIAAAEAELSAAEKQLSSSLAQIQSGLLQIETGLSQIETGRSALKSSRAEIAEGFTEYYKGKAEAEAEFADAEKEFKDARKDLAEAKETIEDIERPDTYVLDRNTNVGYACFESDSGIVDGIAKVFPIFFFLVAALVCMTTMTRMVDEQRTQIGVLKALGYSNGAVIGKYLFYAGSASFIGCVIGFFACCYIFPLIIWNAYGMMYDFSGDLFFIFDEVLGLIVLAVALLCSMGATLFSCLADFREVPAQLIRPKAPKDGKRILLERIPFIWNRLSFLYKVSFRNIFRYKKRFFMMVLGISGCTALLLTGLGINDSVKNVVNYQYDEIQVYDYSIVFNKNMNAKRQQTFTENSAAYVDDMIFIHQNSADLTVGRNVKNVTLIASDNENFDDFIRLYDNEGSAIPYPKTGEAVICKKLADSYGLAKGSSFVLRDENHKEMTVTVSGICENFIENYVYIAPETAADQWGYDLDVKSALVYAAGSSADEDSDSSADEDAVYASSAKALNEDIVTTVTVNNDFRDRVNSMMESLNYVIALVVISAGALAFIVLYNLTNINITERIREIATIKVLGFYPAETSAYVFRENFFLTGISALVGLGLGKALHAFVMSEIQVDLISFDVRITPLSYVLAFILTFVFAGAVNLAMYYKLDRISMTESLKSIE